MCLAIFPIHGLLFIRLRFDFAGITHLFVRSCLLYFFSFGGFRPYPHLDQSCNLFLLTKDSNITITHLFWSARPDMRCDFGPIFTMNTESFSKQLNFSLNF